MKQEKLISGWVYVVLLAVMLFSGILLGLKITSPKQNGQTKFDGYWTVPNGTGYAKVVDENGNESEIEFHELPIK